MEKYVIVTVHSKPDLEGKQSFTLQWPADNVGPKRDQSGLRGQEFRAVLNDHIKDFQNRGYNVRYASDNSTCAK